MFNVVVTRRWLTARELWWDVREVWRHRAELSLASGTARKARVGLA